jgi:N-acetylglucosaminylphosphatidylinositol deacetylase
LGIQQCETIDEQDIFPDSMRLDWDKHKVAEFVRDYIPKYEKQVDTILTFDHFGVSSHINHISVSLGCEIFMQKYSKETKVKELYELVTTNVPRKFTGLYDIFLTKHTNLNSDKD